MDCESRLICALDRITEQLGSWNMADFVSTLIATLVGAAIAGLVAWLVFRGETNQEHEARLTDAVEELSTAMTRTAREFEIFTEQAEKHFTLEASEAQSVPPPATPDRIDLDVRLDMLIARARGKQRHTAEQIRQVAYELSFIRDARWASAEYAALRRVIVGWRAKRLSEAETRAALLALDERRTKKEENPSIKEEELPERPENFERVRVGA